MGIVQRFERRLEGAVGNASARVFGGGVLPHELQQALAREVADGVRELSGGHLLAPNRYTVMLSDTDHGHWSQGPIPTAAATATAAAATAKPPAADELARWLTQHIAEQGWQTYGVVVVELIGSPALHPGQFRTSSTVDPDANDDPPFYPGAAAMSESNGRNRNPAPQGRGDEAPRTWAAQPAYPQQTAYDQQAPAQGNDPRNYDPQGYYDQGYRTPATPDNVGPAGWNSTNAPATGSLHLDDGSSRSYQLKRGTNILGRGQEAQFRVADTGVSRRHAEITWDGYTAMLTDLGSTNGTTVNGSPVQSWQLADGDVVHAGHTTIVVRIHG